MKSVIKKLEQAVVHHPVFQNVEETVLSQVAHPSRQKIIMVLGPTGAGKTTLIDRLDALLSKQVASDPELGFGPPVVLQATDPETGEFGWKDFYWSSLMGPLGEPGMHRKLDINEAVDGLRKQKSQGTYRSLTTYQLRELMLQVLTARNPIAVFVDEIQALTKTKARVRRQDNLDVLKSLSNKFPIPLIPVGTYEARAMLYASGQGARRVSISDMRRYREEEINTVFADVVSAFTDEVGVPLGADVKRDIGYLYSHSLGCVGVLSSWLLDAAKLADKRGLKVLSRYLLDESRLKNIQLATIAAEIHAHEAEHASEGDFDAAGFFESLATKEGKKDQSPSEPPRIQGGRRIGHRNPVRDPVGR